MSLDETTTLNLTTRELTAMSPSDLQRLAGRAWRTGNNAGKGEPPEDWTRYALDPDAGVNDLAGALGGKLVLRSENDTEIAVYLVGNEILGVGDSHGLWLVRIGLRGSLLDLWLARIGYVVLS